MSKIVYEHHDFRQVSLDVIAEAERICREYARQGIRMTLRTLYYQFIARDTFPESWRDSTGTKNNQPNYKRLSGLISDARIAGLIDWSWIEDSGRPSRGGDYGIEGGPAELIRGLPSDYSITKWEGQPNYVEVMFEKDALTQIIADPCRRWNVTYTACKGSPSTSLMEETAQRLRYYARAGRDVTVYYLGDHDPTGLMISDDIERRLRLYRCGTDSVHVERIALNWDQIQEFSPPPSPAKEADSRTQGYIDRFGTTDTWELDALDPVTMRQLVETAILSKLDQDMWDERQAQEDRDRLELTAIADNWEQVRQYMEDEGLIGA